MSRMLSEICWRKNFRSHLAYKHDLRWNKNKPNNPFEPKSVSVINSCIDQKKSMSNDEEVTALKLTIARQEATIARQEALINDQLELIREMNDSIAKLKVCTNALTLESIYQSPSKALRLQ